MTSIVTSRSVRIESVRSRWFTWSAAQSWEALLTLLDSGAPSVALTCGELAERWAALEKLPGEEANAFADDIERARAFVAESVRIIALLGQFHAR